MEDKREKHFVLVHGSCHGAWCWYKLATLLRSDGHRVTALDLTASGIHPKQMQEVHSVSDYLEPLMEFMAALPPEDKVVMVGHSMGGVGLSVAMERYPEKIAFAVFATALMPGPGLNYLTICQEIQNRMNAIYMDSRFTFDQASDKRHASVLFGPKLLESKFYQLCPPEDLTLATLLARPHPSRMDAKPSEELLALTKENYGSVRRVYVVAEQDIILPQEVQRWMIELNPPDEVKVIPGADHMLMFSKPQHLSSCLQEIAHQY